jgi:hypothetical protein
MIAVAFVQHMITEKRVKLCLIYHHPAMEENVWCQHMSKYSERIWK